MATITVPARTHRSTTSSSQWSHFVKDKKVGEGTYAVVYLGWAIPAEPAAVEKDLEGDDTGERDHLLRDKKVGVQAEGKRRIAIKKIKAGLFKDGLDMSAIREVKALQELKHPNVIELIDVYSHKMNLNLVLEYLDADLEMIIKNKAVTLSAGDIKSWMLMTLRGLYHCHNNFILHRDLKPNNLLLASDGQLKLADFGMARDYGNPHRAMTSMVVTRWYRSPELLLGAKHYGYAIDMWAVGCIFAELMLRVPFMAAESDIAQLQVIFHALGTPTESEWPGMTQLPDYHEFKAMPKNPLRATFTAASPDALTFLENLLVYDPLKRPTTEQALKHFYFRNHPRPTPPNKLPRDVGGAGAQQKAVAPDDPEAAARPGIKRKAPDFPDHDFEMGGVPGAKVARKLF
ncbi:kinase-like domain-containing protein [Fimicolochytrium jonesii]|uniref:kinase-like domain-containing protein n=1 Tax=Fimicolochytrium jonesii TaxID=1396493 RepID=UPI0022FEA3EE|nr:kinase-like domain-containing protein [Fimicolochytrium jonesii]KAI8819648.1 kinase-like domain-containing protein [Fimicolochytrium jonesii]